ncbi:Spectrin beta chain, non-erythrocytic 5 [Mortierella sp. GBA30]|nr:Spectrin beta chain, non-erythrocytic 5 [Mortierella sp. GBA30]
MAWQFKNKRLMPVGPGSLINSTSPTTQHAPLNSLSSSANPGQGVLHPINDGGEDMVRQFNASQIDTQKTAFLRWVNVQLATTTAYGPMTAIEKDLRDGKRLIGLIEVVSKEPLKPERGNMRIHQMANVSKALSFLEKRTNEPLGSIGNEDIVDGNVKLTLGLIWIVIYRFQIQGIANTMTEFYPSLTEDMHNMDGDDIHSTIVKGKKKGSSQQVDAKQALLRWVRFQLEDYADVIPPILDFHRSWRTGIAFAALIHRHDPTFLPDFYSAVLRAPHETIDQWRATLTMAFETAFEKMSLPRLLDPEDLVDVEVPDERSIMTYVSEYYLVMAKHQKEQDPVQAEELKVHRVQAKEERVALAGEDQQAALRRVQEEEERKKREEEEELERIRLRRLEIEGWSIRAAERAREEEEARRKRKEEEEEKSLQRKLRREQREREKTKKLLKVATGNSRRKSSISEATSPNILALAESELALPKTPMEPMDPEEIQRRQKELDEKLAFYLRQVNDLLEWVQNQQEHFPEKPDTNVHLDRTRDVDPFKIAAEQAEEKRVAKEAKLNVIHSTREEILDYESPELTSEQVSEVDKAWWELDSNWTAFSKRTAEAKATIQEMQWIVECAQEIDTILGDIQRFEEQLKAIAEKRAQDSLQDRSQPATLDHQDTSIATMGLLLKKYAETLSTLLESNIHTAPEYLSTQNSEVIAEHLPQLGSHLEVAQRHLSNDRLLKEFLGSFAMSVERIESISEWLASVGIPRFVSDDVWTAGESIKEYLARDTSRDDNLEQFQSTLGELQTKLDEERAKMQEIRSDGLGKLEQDAQAAIQSLEETHDATAENTTKTVRDMLQETTGDLKKVEDRLPKEVQRCTYAARVLDYLLSVRSTLSQLESAFSTVNGWVITQPSTDVEAAVQQVEVGLAHLESTFRSEDVQPVVWDSIHVRHSGLSSLVKDLRSCFREKQEILKGDQQMKEFLELTQACQMMLREFRSQLYNDAPYSGFTSEDTTPFDEFSALVSSVGQSVDAFESEKYPHYEEIADAITKTSNAPGSRQDPTIVEAKITSVTRLVSIVRSLRLDRERDVVTLAECRRVALLLQTVNVDLASLESRFVSLEITDPEQKATLSGLIDQAGQLANDFLLLEQKPVFRYVGKDPSCIPMLKEIRERLSKIQQTQTLLQSGLEVGEQWSILWDQFKDRAETLRQYLDETEKEITGRGIVALDGFADGDSNWKKSEDVLQETELANNKMLLSLKEFQKQRMFELGNLKVSLHQSVQLSGGIESLDQIRTEQYHEAERLQQQLREYLQRLYLLNSQEAFQLEILGQRLVWSQQLAESKKHLSSSILACQGIVDEYAQLLSRCSQSNDTSDLSAKTAEQLKTQMEKITTTAATQKEATFDVTLTIHKSLSDLATMAAPGEKEPVEKKVPLHLEVELYEFKSQYTILDQHLEYARQVVDHAIQATTFVRKIDVMDSGFARMVTEFRAEKEASPKSIEKLNAIRMELNDLTEEIATVVKFPKPADKVADAYTSSQRTCRSDLEKLLKKRLDSSRDFNRILDPLLIGFKALLAYQEGLRELAQELNGHDRWVSKSAQKVQWTHDQIKQMFSSWPGDEFEQRKANPHEAMVIFDVDEQVVVDDLEVLMADMDKELAHVQAQKHGFFLSKQKVQQALLAATVHSQQMQMELEWYIENLAGRIQQLEIDIRSKSLQLQALEKRAIWEVEIEVARSWFKDFAKAVILFAREQTKWKANHKELDDGASIRSIRTTASRMQMDRLGLSVIEFEEQVEIFETESRPRVNKAWSELCSSLAFIARTVPDEFKRRQNALGHEFEEIRKQVGYSAHIVTQRKSLEDVAYKLGELEGYKEELKAGGISINSGRSGHENQGINQGTNQGIKMERLAVENQTKKKKGKGWSRFQAKVKKLTRK